MIHRSKEVRGWGVGEMEDRTLTTAPEFTSYFLARKRILIHKSGSRMFSGEIHGAQISDSLQKSSNSADLTFSVQVTKSGLRALIWGSLRWDGRLPIVLDEDNTGLREQQCIRPRNLWSRRDSLGSTSRGSALMWRHEAPKVRGVPP